MPLVIPPSTNYQSPIVATPSIWQNDPKEGFKSISIEIDWANMGGSANCVGFQFSNNATLSFNQLVAISVDNSACGSDVRFMFPDTSTTLLVPAYEVGTFPVFTNALSFYVQALDPENMDVTNFVMHNGMPPTDHMPRSTFQTQATASTQPITAPGTFRLVPVGVSGTLEAVFLNYTVPGAAANWEIYAQIRDGSNPVNQMFPFIISGEAGAYVNGTPINVGGYSLRFTGGLLLYIGTTSVCPSVGQCAVSLTYRSP